MVPQAAARAARAVRRLQRSLRATTRGARVARPLACRGVRLRAGRPALQRCRRRAMRIDIVQLCWDRLGWASPFHVEIGGSSGEFEVDEVSMGLLQLSCRRFPLSSAASRALAGGGLEALRRDTGAFLAIELSEGEGAPPTLRAVGSEEDLERIETQLRSFE